MHSKLSRRTLLRGAAGSAALAGIGAPALVTAQADAIRIGHLTPLTGFLGPLGEYAVMGVKLEEWLYDLPEDDFAMEKVNFRALWVKVEDASA